MQMYPASRYLWILCQIGTNICECLLIPFIPPEHRSSWLNSSVSSEEIRFFCVQTDCSNGGISESLAK